MNPLRIAEQLRTDYLQLLTTTFAPRQEHLKRDFRAAVEREGFLTREPFVSLALPYQGAPALTELLPETRERFGAIAETPYAHQGEAVRRILGSATSAPPSSVKDSSPGSRLSPWHCPIKERPRLLNCCRRRGSGSAHFSK